MLDVTVSPVAGNAGSIAAYPTGNTEPASAAFAWPATQVTQWSAAMGLGSLGAVSFDVKSGGSVNLTVAVLGYFISDSTGEDGFVASEARVLNTTNVGGSPLAPGETRDIQLTGTNGIPTMDVEPISTVAVDVLAAPASTTTSGSVSAFSGDASSGLSAVTFDGITASSLTMITLGYGGDIRLHNSANGPVDIILDLEGWFDGKPGGDAAVQPGETESVPDTTPPTATPVPTSSYNLTGTLANGAGTGIGGMSVSLYATDVEVNDPTTDTAFPLVAQTTTDAAGNWTMTIPSPLPADVQPLADQNGGILNAQLVSTGAAPDGTTMAAVSFLSITGTTTSSPSDALQTVAQQDTQPINATFYPTQQNAQTSFDDGSIVDASTDSSYMQPANVSTTDVGAGDPAAATGVLAQAPSESLNGVDYSSAVPTDTSRFCPPPVYWHTAKRENHVYTPIGEDHGAWDAIGNTELSFSQSQSYGIELSYNNKDFSISKSSTFSGAWGKDLNKHEAKHGDAHQVDVPIDYKKVHSYYKCTDGTKKTIYWSWRAVQYDPKYGQDPIAYGLDVSYQDGYRAMLASAKKNRDTMGPNETFRTWHSNSQTYQFSASFLPISMTTSTTFSKTVGQGISTGPKSRYWHIIWGPHGEPFSKAGVHVFYSY